MHFCVTSCFSQYNFVVNAYQISKKVLAVTFYKDGEQLKKEDDDVIKSPI